MDLWSDPEWPFLCSSYVPCHPAATHKSRSDPAEWGAKLEDRFYNNKAFEEAATVKEEVRESVRDPAIESELDTRGLYQTSTHEIEEKAATKIQAAYRGYRVRETVRRMKELARDAANRKEES
ncbi:sperm surface protein Sp17 isoform X2 [Pelodiscus sinensis]|uniref:sperm surface protein Sp17 isoform X2 n=1 Tax=Pelodiscus sinensis TaxID=13735 RepID=UPI003F6CDAF2